MKKVLLVLVLVAMVPLLGTSSAKADPNQSCYLDSGHTRTETIQFLGMSREVQVDWKDGYTCTGDPIQMVVTRVYELVYWPNTGGLNDAQHDIASRILIDYSNNDFGWINTTFDSCGHSPCAVQETYHPNVYMPYAPNHVAVYTYYDSVFLQPCVDDFYFGVYGGKYDGSCDVGSYCSTCPPIDPTIAQAPILSPLAPTVRLSKPRSSATSRTR